MSKDTPVRSTQIFSSTDYDKFKFVRGNRPTNSGHVRALQQSILDNGNLMDEDPIEVDKDFNIYDGQHRFRAAEALKEPVFYVFKENINLHAMRLRNSNRKNWNWLDFAFSYRDDLKREDYGQLIELYETYRQNLRPLLAFCGVPMPNGYKALRDFLNGDFAMQDYERTKMLLDQYWDLTKVAGVKNKQFAMASCKFLQTSTYNHARMLEQLRLHKSVLNDCYMESHYLFALQDIWRTS